MTPKELTRADVMQFVEITNGTFTVNQIKEYLNIVTPAGKANLYKILSRMEEAEILVRMSTPGTYRKKQIKKIPMDWENADTGANLPIQLPFNLHTLCKVYRKSIIVVTASKNGGKTAFALQSIQMNMNQFQVDFYNSETGAEQLKDRFDALKVPHPAPFPVYEAYSDFSDLIDPTHFSVIDYLDFNSEFYKAGDEIEKIFQKLTTGVALIFIQRPPAQVSLYKGKKQTIERDYGYGGALTAKRAVLYVSMGYGKLKIVHCKTPMDKKVNPDNMMWTYSFDENGFFKDIKPYFEVSDDDFNA
jgi:hypothetical protein